MIVLLQQFFIFCHFSSVLCLNLKILEFKVSPDKGAGMDGGTFGIKAFGGGRLKVKICSNGRCCKTENLNTEADNWERNQRNFFIGRQLEKCNNFKIKTALEINLIHTGSDGLKLTFVKAYGSNFPHPLIYYECPVNEKIEKKILKVFCFPKHNEDTKPKCNGHSKFCKIKLDKFTFPGTHNSGTGQSEGFLPCYSKNQDLNVEEQLSFGIRFYDMDVIYSKKLLNCNGMELGHGSTPEFGFYQCYGLLEIFLTQLKNWLDSQGNRDVVVLYFGSIDFENITLPHLKKILLKVLENKLDTHFKKEGTWPTLEESISSGKNVVVFLRTDKPIEELQFIREIKYDVGSQKVFQKGELDVLSTFDINSFTSKDCSHAMKSAKKICKAGADSTFKKLAIFGGPITQCLWVDAEKCNVRVSEAYEACFNASGGKPIQFIQEDYPNFLGSGMTTVAEFTYSINMNKNKR